MINSNYDINVIQRIPFLQNFPFTDYILTASENSFSIDKETVTFSYKNKINSTLRLFEKEIYFLDSISNNITKLNSISKLIDESLLSEDITSKRDAISILKEWALDFDTERKTPPNYDTFTGVLMGMLESFTESEKIQVVDILDKLNNKKGIIRLLSDQEQIISGYYQFQLIYFKTMLGIIIASKISI